jgi:hypothetical protein
MKRVATLGTVLLALTVQPAAVPPLADPIHSFRPLSTFLVPDRTSAEIVAATPDGMTLIYTDALGARLGIVDISDPAQPVQTAVVGIDGQPTSVAVTPDGRYAVAAVKRAALVAEAVVDPSAPAVPGELQLFDLHDLSAPPVVFAIAPGPDGALGYLPDSIALGTVSGELYAAVALENEPIVLRLDGSEYRYVEPEPAGLPACPAAAGPGAPALCDASDTGFVQIVRIHTSGVPSMAFVANAAFPAPLMGGLLYPDDPQPEYVAFSGSAVAVTLQENNGVGIVDLTFPAAPAVTVFDAGVVASRSADLLDDATISFTQTYPDDVLAGEPTAGTRIPDAIAWTRDGQLITANEGEFNYTGGRGWSMFHVSGALLWDDEGALEQMAVRRGQYPDGRSDAKGIEPEGIATGVFGNREFAFVTAERAAFVAVYDLGGPRPRFLQLLPTGLRPEAALAIPSRNLFVTADEGDDGDGSISIFEGVTGRWNGTSERPLLESRSADEPWSALSGFAADLHSPMRLYSVPDDALQSDIYQIDIAGPSARISTRVPVTRNGAQARYDLEGIAVDTSIAAPGRGAGFWLASEGTAACDAGDYTANLLVQVDAAGNVIREIGLPSSIEPSPGCASRPAGSVTSNGFEGVAITADGRYLLTAIQRPFAGEAPGTGATHTRIGRYDLLLEQWDFYSYPYAKVTSAATIGLSEITPFGRTATGEEIFAVIERDNRYGLRALHKQVRTFTLPGSTCAATDAIATCQAKGAEVSSSLFRDIAGDFAPLEKVEALAMTRTGDVWIALDNDGGEVEPRLIRVPRR